MPLQKAPPQSAFSADKPLLTYRQTIRERRRTLQTISELSTQNVEPSECDWRTSGQSNNTSSRGTDGVITSIESTKRNRRRSLPQHGARFENDLNTKPSILVTPADAPFLRRSLTDPIDCTRGSRHQSSGELFTPRNDLSRLSVGSFCSFHSQDPPLPPVAEGSSVGLKNSHPYIDVPTAQVNRMGSKGKQPMKMRDGSGAYGLGQGWKARRERESVEMEQAVVEAKARRERDGRGIVVGSSSRLPAMSPLPIANVKDSHSRIQASHQQSLENLRAMNNNRTPLPLDRRTSYSQIVPMHQNGIKRTGSAASTTRLANPDPAYQPVPQLLKSSARRSLRSPIAQEPHRPNPTRSSSSLRPSPVSTTGSSSMQSSVSSNPHRTHQSSRTSTSYFKPTGTSAPRHSQQYVAKGRSIPFPALTNSMPQTNHHISSATQQTVQDPRARRGSQASQSSNRHSLASQRSRSQSHLGSQPSIAHFHAISNASTIIYDENPDKRGMDVPRMESVRLLREREKLVRWKAEREKAEFERTERAKIRERVRRANELEEEKEKELAKQMKKKKSWLCGLLRSRA
ncbi:hypothetical protein BU26DRAFT_499858 [Trematosphaeria pertusa]|uniref:Uncharacterized protein n=1 Tax=Trematosphaeria pertusa TaxID=390896 RepID=A0A6A6J4Q3_9PLEO|nr:uncharacterized protein BU26DRAFT_499858 [Trematosphaeria pertusa]KAF2257347.1 hypothetical protein BU26DRAFT_499858 [Trematosphaeria pertusa]